MDWLTDLYEKAGKAAEWRAQFPQSYTYPWHTADDLYDDALEREECDFAAEASPERVRALCELAEAVGHWRHGNADTLELLELHDALASLEPARPTWACSGASYHLPACGGACGEEEE